MPESSNARQDRDTGTRGEQAGREEEQSSHWSPLPGDVKVDVKRAVIGGSLAFVVTLAGAWTVGQASGAEARALLEASLSTARTFCGDVTLALGNILALMLTLLGLSAATDIDLRWSHYLRIKQIAWITTVALIAAVLIYLLLNVPLEQSEEAAQNTSPSAWFSALYYATLALSSLLGGALIAVALMLYHTVRDLIYVLGPKKTDASFVHTEDGDDEPA